MTEAQIAEATLEQLPADDEPQTILIVCRNETCVEIVKQKIMRCMLETVPDPDGFFKGLTADRKETWRFEQHTIFFLSAAATNAADQLRGFSPTSIFTQHGFYEQARIGFVSEYQRIMLDSLAQQGKRR